MTESTMVIPYSANGTHPHLLCFLDRQPRHANFSCTYCPSSVLQRRNTHASWREVVASIIARSKWVGGICTILAANNDHLRIGQMQGVGVRDIAGHRDAQNDLFQRVDVSCELGGH